MSTAATAAIILAGISLTAGLFILLVLIFLGFAALLVYWFLAVIWRPRHKAPGTLSLQKHRGNPILRPEPTHWWESEAVFNPAAFVHNGSVHMLYRAIGHDGASRIGYAKSHDGVHFTRSDAPAYDPSAEILERAKKGRLKKLSYETLSYSPASYGSGGGWGGSEDPRAVVIDEEVYMTFTSFEGWNNVRMMMAALDLQDLDAGIFNWHKGIYLSSPGQVQKNWVLFPEKVTGKYALLHNIYPNIEIAYFDPEHIGDSAYITSHFERHTRKGHWDTWVRGAGTPPLKTSEGWLLLYHATDEKEPQKYKVGAMLLDLNDPTRILYRSENPILEPNEWYENDWKPGVVYASGAVIFNDDLIVYYGGGDKYIGAAKVNLKKFLHSLKTHTDTGLMDVQV